ncbi:NUDIX hydrolase [Lentzea sp. BCCO 10_0856]|uniref:NUDIX hydrolase n=1 Tax=Lentzea miocenica TaxID=3095431 RepID=A0ABU4TDU2_9PSEU|nr:NUDIX hydrolase [Lentzea sp. BCCO 10_0856]MDX8036235.1 NUDIX hydrolase [Lentzea sp. BCCO 10_0856]
MTGSSERTIRCVGALVHDSNGRLLLVRRANPPGEGLWSIPGGRVEPKETDEAAVTREVAEETGLSVTVGRLVGSVERPAPNGVFLIFDYECQVTSGVLRAGDDASDVAWVDSATLATLPTTDGLLEALSEWNWLPRA